MARLPLLKKEDLSEEAAALWDSVQGSRGAGLVGPEGGLVGPFNSWLYSPAVGQDLAALGARLRFRTSLDRRLTEVAIISVGAHWKAEFEWWAHARMAAEAGVDEGTIDAIAAGEEPTGAPPDEQTVHRVARQLVTAGEVDDATYRAGVELVGHRGMVELISLCGYYCLVSFLLNAFEVPLPADQEPRWRR